MKNTANGSAGLIL